nr:nidogen-1 [Oryctolagus cuniculus]
MRAAWMRALLLQLLLAGPGGCLSRQELFPFGPGQGDLELEDGDDLVSPALELSGALHFYDRSDIDSVYVTTNGIIAMSEPLAKESHPGLFPPGFGVVTPFLVDLDTTDGLRKVYYREDLSPSIMQLAAECVQRGFPEVSFQPSSVVVVTWESVAAYQGPNQDPIQEGKLPANINPRETAGDVSSTWVPATHMGDPDGVPNSILSLQHLKQQGTRCSPQRVNGKVKGRIFVGTSQVPVVFENTDLHSYVVMNHGRSYTAISTIPETVGYSLLPLAPIGGIIGWMFAVEQDGFKNGFSITGGEFTRRAAVTFVGYPGKLVIKQQFSGIDEHGHLTIDTELEGRVPQIPFGSSVHIEPYTELYHYSSSDIDECVEQPSVCGSHALCNNHPGTFRCECVEGYQFSDQGTCVDVDECQPSRCHPDAFCYNTPGSFTCQCKPGYQGDGFRCIPGGTVMGYVALLAHCCLCEGGGGAADAQRPRPPGLFVPKCDEHGHYSPTQCHGSTGYCWCVDRDGREVEGTRTRPGMRPPCLSTVAPPIHQRPLVPTAVIPLPPGTHLLFAQTGKIENMLLDGNTKKKTEAKALLHMPGPLTSAKKPHRPGGFHSGLGAELPTEWEGYLGSPEGIAVDHLGRNIFWTDSQLDRIEVAKLDGTQRRVLFETDLVNPRGIVTDSTSKKHLGAPRCKLFLIGLSYFSSSFPFFSSSKNLYWTDWNRDNPKIETSYMDGTNHRILVQDDLGLPNGLTFDTFSSQLCWVGAGTNRAECLHPSQPGRRKVLEGLQYPFAVTSYGKNLYYTDWKTNSVVAVDLAVSKEMDSFHPHKQTRLYGITTALSQCPQGDNYCSVNNGGCTHLCLATPGSRTCRCPDNTMGVDCIERK